MRELKFRAWRYGELLENVTPVANIYNNFFPDPAIVIFEANGEVEETEDVSCIEQFTGLKDKNGKEIYEGDIIGVEQEYSDESGKEWTKIGLFGVVSFEKGEFGVWGNPLYGNETKHFHDLADGQWIVLGNIYENKELLK